MGLGTIDSSFDDPVEPLVPFVDREGLAEVVLADAFEL